MQEKIELNKQILNVFQMQLSF